MKYRICISSPPDRERLVAEVFFDDVQWVELNQEKERLRLEFYARPDGEPWRIDLETAIEALEAARKRLCD